MQRVWPVGGTPHRCASGASCPGPLGPEPVPGTQGLLEHPLITLCFPVSGLMCLLVPEAAGPCPQGHYCPRGSAMPQPCPPGTFSARLKLISEVGRRQPGEEAGGGEGPV